MYERPKSSKECVCVCVCDYVCVYVSEREGGKRELVVRLLYCFAAVLLLLYSESERWFEWLNGMPRFRSSLVIVRLLYCFTTVLLYYCTATALLLVPRSSLVALLVLLKAKTKVHASG